jgi:hypothetical protein
MSALDELKDENNWGSCFTWLGERSLKLEIVPEIVNMFSSLESRLAEALERNAKLSEELRGWLE